MNDRPVSDLGLERKWYAKIKGKRRGPLSTNELRGMRIDGKVTAQTLSWCEGMPDWQPLGSIPELAALAGYAPANQPQSGVTNPHLPPPLPGQQPSRFSTDSSKSFKVRAFDFSTVRLKPLLRRLQDVPRKWLNRGAMMALATVGVISFWRTCDFRTPMVEGRSVLAERRIVLPETPGLFAIQRAATVAVPGCGAMADAPEYKADVEFLLRGDFATDSRSDYILSQVECTTGNELKTVKTVRCIKQPMAGRADLLRLIPAQILPPGFYQLNSLGCFTVQPAAYKQTLTSRADTALKSNDWDEGLSAMRTWLALAARDPELDAKRLAWSEQILKQLDSTKSVATARLLELTTQAVAWQPALQPKAARLLLNQAEMLLKQNVQTVPDAEALLRQVLKFDATSSNSVAAAAWNGLARWIVDPPALGKDSFNKLWNLCPTANLSDNVTASTSYQLAQSLALFEQGERARALPQLEALAISSASDPKVQHAAQTILASPTIGRKPLSKHAPVIFRSSESDAPRLTLELLSVEVTPYAVLIGLNAHNQSAEPISIIYSSGASQANTEYSPLYILDDNGQKFDSSSGYTGGRQQPVNNRNATFAIGLEPGEQASLLARFPQVSKGATQVEFVSPKIANQSRWSFPAIELKAGPFDPPLTNLPSLHPDPVAPLNTPQPNADPIPSPIRVNGTLASPTSSPALSPTTNFPLPTPQSSAVAASTTESLSESQPLNSASSGAAAITTPTATTTATATPTATPEVEQNNFEDQIKMNDLYFKAARLRQQFSNMRSQRRTSAFQDSLFGSGDQAYRVAEQARLNNNFSKASVYYKIAIDAIQKAMRP